MNSSKTDLEKARLLRAKAEQQAVEDALHDADVDKLSKADINKLVHELQVHQIELQLQNEELKHTQAELEASQTKYFELYNLAPVGYLTLNEKGFITEANLTFCNLVGQPMQYVSRRPFSHFILPADQDIWYRFKVQLKNENIRHECEFRLVTLDDTELWIRLEVTCDTDCDSGEITCLCAVSDVTGKKHAEQIIRDNNVFLEQKVQERTAELEMSQIELEAFSTAAAHDLSDLLITINGFAQILEDDYAHALDAEALRLLHIIKRDATKMREIIKSIFRLSRISHTELSLAPVDTKKIVTKLWAEKFAEANASVTLNVSDMPEALGDVHLIHDVWTQLLSNAAKFSRLQPVRAITVTGVRKGKQIEYCITDTGMGFDMKFYSHLFKACHKIKSSHEFEGMGIGLSIAHRIIKKHGGDIWATSEPDKGASFYFTLQSLSHLT